MCKWPFRSPPAAKLLPVLALAACGGDPSSATTGIDPTAVPTTEVPTDTGEITTDTSDPPRAGPGFVGRLVQEDGIPMSGEQVLACTLTTCITSSSAPDGTFWIELSEAPLQLSVKTHEFLEDEPRLAAALVPLTVPDEQVVDIGDVVCPTLADGTAWGPESADPQELDLGDGVILFASRADISLGFGASFDNVAAGQLPPALVPSYPGLEEEVLAVYALSPFDAKSGSPMGFSVPTSTLAGTVVNFRTIDALGRGLSEPAVGESDGARATTHDGEGLYELTYLVVSRP